MNLTRCIKLSLGRVDQSRCSINANPEKSTRSCSKGSMPEFYFGRSPCLSVPFILSNPSTSLRRHVWKASQGGSINLYHPEQSVRRSRALTSSWLMELLLSRPSTCLGLAEGRLCLAGSSAMVLPYHRAWNSRGLFRSIDSQSGFCRPNSNGITWEFVENTKSLARPTPGWDPALCILTSGQVI